MIYTYTFIHVLLYYIQSPENPTAGHKFDTLKSISKYKQLNQ